MLKDAAAVARALRRGLGGGGWTKLFVMADTAYNSCCVDEVGTSHIDAQCVVHYSHSCMSPLEQVDLGRQHGLAKVDTRHLVSLSSSSLILNWTLGRNTPVQTVAVAVMAAIILGDQLYTGGIIGAVLIAIGLYFVLWGESEEKKAKNQDQITQGKQSCSLIFLISGTNKRYALLELILDSWNWRKWKELEPCLS